MKITKDVPTDFGVPATTWRLESVTYNPRKKEVTVEVVGFAGSGAGLIGETPIASRTGSLPPDRVDALMASFEGVEGAVFEAFAGSHPDFDGSTVDPESP